MVSIYRFEAIAAALREAGVGAAERLGADSVLVEAAVARMEQPVCAPSATCRYHLWWAQGTAFFGIASLPKNWFYIDSMHIFCLSGC